MTKEELITIDARFKDWTDWNDHLLDDADGGRYIEVYSCPGKRIVFIAGDNDEAMNKERKWFLRGYDDNETELIGIFDIIEKQEVQVV